MEKLSGVRVDGKDYKYKFEDDTSDLVVYEKY